MSPRRSNSSNTFPPVFDLTPVLLRTEIREDAEEDEAYLIEAGLRPVTEAYKARLKTADVRHEDGGAIGDLARCYGVKVNALFLKSLYVVAMTPESEVREELSADKLQTTLGCDKRTARKWSLTMRRMIRRESGLQASLYLPTIEGWEDLTPDGLMTSLCLVLGRCRPVTIEGARCIVPPLAQIGRHLGVSGKQVARWFAASGLQRVEGRFISSTERYEVNAVSGKVARRVEARAKPRRRHFTRAISVSVWQCPDSFTMYLRPESSACDVMRQPPAKAPTDSSGFRAWRQQQIEDAEALVALVKGA